MKITYDDQYLVTVSEDACVMIWKIQDKEGRGLKRDKEVGYAEEILITKSDLEEKVSFFSICLLLLTSFMNDHIQSNVSHSNWERENYMEC